jgi:hypothetical protein
MWGVADPNVNHHDSSHGDNCDLDGFRTFIECQGRGCSTQLPFPSNYQGTRAYFCDRCWIAHGPETSQSMPTIEERREIVKHLTPKAVEFLRGILPADSPILGDLPLSRTADPWTGKESMPRGHANAEGEIEDEERLARALERKAALKAQLSTGEV